MRHDWVFEVLRDMKSYALENDLPALAARVDEALAVAEAEIAAAGKARDLGGGVLLRPTNGRPH